ncbi:hypothetical protein ACJX0J_026674 [Zea mays]
MGLLRKVEVEVAVIRSSSNVSIGNNLAHNTMFSILPHLLSNLAQLINKYRYIQKESIPQPHVVGRVATGVHQRMRLLHGVTASLHLQVSFFKVISNYSHHSRIFITG